MIFGMHHSFCNKDDNHLRLPRSTDRDHQTKQKKNHIKSQVKRKFSQQKGNSIMSSYLHKGKESRGLMAPNKLFTFVIKIHRFSNQECAA